MADLQARLGPKVFPHKTWTRPGYEPLPKSPPKQRKWKRKQETGLRVKGAAGYDSDSSSHEDNSGRDRNSSHHDSKTRTASLLQRMGFTPDGSEDDISDDVDAELVEKTLIERLGSNSVEKSGCGRLFTGPIADSEVVRAPVEDNQDMDLDSGSDNEIRESRLAPTDMLSPTTLDNPESATTLNQKRRISQQSTVDPGQKGRTTSAAGVEHATKPFPQPRTNSLEPSGLPPSPNGFRRPSDRGAYINMIDNTKKQLAAITTRIHSDEGELSRSTSQDGSVVRNVLLLHMQMNAEARVQSDAAHGSQFARMDSNVITNNAVAQFDQLLQNAGAELRVQSSDTLNRSRPRTASTSTAAGLAEQANVAGVPREGPPSSGPSQFHQSSFIDGSRPGSTDRRTSGYSLRYTPSPQRRETTSKPSYSPTSPKIPDSRSQKHRSPSPVHRTRNHRERAQNSRNREKERERNYDSRRSKRAPEAIRRTPSPLPRRPRKPYIPKQMRSTYHPEPQSHSPSPTRSVRSDKSPSRTVHRLLGHSRERQSRSREKQYNDGVLQSAPRAVSASDTSPNVLQSQQTISSTLETEKPGSSHDQPSTNLHEIPVLDMYPNGRQTSEIQPVLPKASTRHVTPAVEPIATGSRSNSVLPCHNVPGLWFARLGMDTLGTNVCVFDVDAPTTVKWNLPMTSNSKSEDPIKQKISLELCCFHTSDVETVMANLGADTTPYNVAHAVSDLKHQWPTQGNLIISIQAMEKTWLPSQLVSAPLHLEPYIHEGQNVVQLIQLGPMQDRLFVLLATNGNGLTNFVDGPPSDYDFVPPQIGTDSDTILTGNYNIRPAILTVTTEESM